MTQSSVSESTVSNKIVKIFIVFYKMEHGQAVKNMLKMIFGHQVQFVYNPDEADVIYFDYENYLRENFMIDKDYAYLQVGYLYRPPQFPENVTIVSMNLQENRNLIRNVQEKLSYLEQRF